MRRVERLAAAVLAVTASVLLGPAAGCQRSLEELKQDYAEGVKGKLAALEKVGELAAKAPPVTEDRIAWEAEDLDPDLLEPNVTVLHIEEFKNLTVRVQLATPKATNRSLIVDAAHAAGLTDPQKGDPATYAVDEKYDPGNREPEQAERKLESLSKLRYALVVRTLSYVPPKMTGESTFHGGAFEGEVLVFDVDKAKLLGGYRIGARNQATVGTREGRNEANLAADMHFSVKGAVRDGLKKHTPALQKR